MQNQNNSLRNENNELENQRNELQNQISQLQNNVSALQNQIRELQDQIDMRTNKVLITDLSSEPWSNPGGLQFVKVFNAKILNVGINDVNGSILTFKVSGIDSNLGIYDL